jgi:biopolymer transport protein ExbD
MAMMVAGGEGEEDEVLAAINTTPLVDVMLVLLIIFLITIPVVTKTIPVELPLERNQPRLTKPENINISVNREGRIFWDESLVANANALTTRLKTISVLSPQPEVQIRADGNARYEMVGRVVFACQRSGIQKIGFITEPPPRI